MATVSTRVESNTYTPMKLPMSREAYNKGYYGWLRSYKRCFTLPSLHQSFAPLATTLVVIKTMLDSKSVVPYNKEQVAKAGDYFAK